MLSSLFTFAFLLFTFAFLLFTFYDLPSYRPQMATANI